MSTTNPIFCGKKVFNMRAEKIFREASDCFYMKKYDMALDLLEQVVSLDKNHTKAFLLIGDINLLNEGCETEALLAYEKAILSNPTSAQALGSKAYVLDILGRYDDALENCEKAFLCVNDKDNDQLSSLFDQKISLLCSLHKYDDASKVLNEAIRKLNEENANYIRSCYSQKINLQKKSYEKSKQPNLKLIF